MLHDGILLLSPGLKLAIAGILLLAAGHDIMTRTVPNWMPLSLGVLATILAAIEFRLAWGLGFGLAVFVLCVIFWWRGWMGGGDVKLLGATAIVVAPAAAGSFVLAVSLSGGVLAMAYLVGRVLVPRPAAQRPRHLLRRVLRVEAWRIRHRGPLPYACAIAAGTIFVLS
ncbi:prepilin peptidase [Acidisphaera sp. S103]|uniref:A24 family peptidase n=1 Tax=Acidisphaera sp. S103 TaxID=1747223 RepID=UPI00131B6401|nr:prepilin peptidase [Acidisphaera sp. S103]